MDEFKHKILGLLNKQSPKIPSMGFSDANYHFPQMETLSINSKTASDENRPADQEILESIEAAYFAIEPTFDICRFELNKLPTALDCDQIQRDFTNLKRQHQVVSKKVLQLILEHQADCTTEFKEIVECRDEVRATLEQCQMSRHQLKIVAHQFRDCLTLLANHRKRRLAHSLLDNLKMIRHLHSFDERLQAYMADEDYAGAIVELKRCQKVATQFRHFECVAAVICRLQETLDSTDGELDRVLAQTCYRFDSERYRKLVAAFNLLERSEQSIIDSLHVHYITAIYNSALNVVSTYAGSEDLVEGGEASGKNPYKALCQSISTDQFIPCLLDLCKILFKIILSHHQLATWHQTHLTPNPSIQTLTTNQTKLWDDVQRKVSSLLLNANLATYKFDQFVQVLSIVHRLIQVGDEFAASQCDDLQESIRRQSVHYFHTYHRQRMDELRIYLEHDAWTICPVRATFTPYDLHEFGALKQVLRNYKFGLNVSTGTSDCSSNQSLDGSSLVCNYFVRCAIGGTPFDRCLEVGGVGDSGEEFFCVEKSAGYGSEESEEEEEEEEELRGEFVEEGEGTTVRSGRGKGVILTNTTLSVLRQMGRYLQMCRLLKPIAWQVIASMNQLFDFYLYAVHGFFTTDLTVSSKSLYTNELNTTLKKISDNLIMESYEETTAENENRILKPNLSQMVNLNQREQLNGLAERIIGVESVIFLAQQYENLHDFLEFLIPNTNRIMLQQFFAQNISSAKDLRKPIYMSVVAQAFDLRQILLSMSKINWEIKEVMSQHNAYIDLMLREVQIFTLRLEEVKQKVVLNDEILKAIWENIAHVITHTLVQGFSVAKKCSNGGRALMQLDFIQFVTKFENISGLRPIPHREYVESYVKAYYLPENELEKWIRNHLEYSAKHLFGLISCTCQNNKKSKQRLLQVVEETEKERSDR